MRRPLLLAVLAASALTAAAALIGTLLAFSHQGTSASGLTQVTSPYRGSTPPPGIVAPDFTLRDYRGRTFTMSRLRGHLVLLSFVDTKCKQQCPIVTSMMALALTRLPRTARAAVVPLLMSVNPKLDTPANIHTFLARRHALALNYLIGSVAELRPLWRAYGVIPAIDTGNADIHSSDVRIFDRKGIWVATQHAGLDLTPANLAADMLTALRRSP